MNNAEDKILYAEIYKNLNINGTQYLAFRDINQYIRQYHLHDSTILDYGCGAGKSTRFLKNFSVDVTGVDINNKMIEAALEKDPLGQYYKIKSAKTSFANNSYDLVFSSWVLVEISSTTEIQNILQEIHRILKPGGIYITAVGNENTYSRKWLSLNTSFRENKNLTSGQKVKVYLPDIDLTIFDYYWSYEDYIEIFKLSKFELLDTHLPIGSKQDGYLWKDEISYAPYTIYVIKKI